MDANLTLRTSPLGDRALVSVSGEVDLATAGELSDHALEALRTVSPHVVVDLTDVSFMDSTGLKSLITIDQRTALAGGSFSVVGPSRSVRKLLSLTGLDETFRVYDSVDQVSSDAEPTP